ncbi:hypothetical protein KUG47_01775 [Falsochrobactrum sp. TDYN1]|uniref:Uncharacterized protein n=1 Tax=Falsochrobactrum tianjinense TaxID=2706015 RepID=A0A949PK21_9HYPH|nr:hypothetical protein [Falsochrobactrum sp. TDYN1]MBV2142223.1 hypothetical protein [Falsochrobactrum sp. TDYN1]
MADTTAGAARATTGKAINVAKNAGINNLLLSITLIKTIEKSPTILELLRKNKFIIKYALYMYFNITTNN